MSNTAFVDKEIEEKAKLWLSSEYDEETRNQVKDLLENNQEELVESFYTDLEFGTGGLRGIMGVGTNRMNVYTVGMATQGLANYLNKSFPNTQIKIAIAHDPRNNSPLFARTVADVMSANGIKVYLFDALRPTPELSFAIRHFGCQSGVVVTASHNPKEYNGYKVYWDDGAQVIAPHDKGIIEEVRKVDSPSKVKFSGNESLIEIIGEAVDKEFLKASLDQCLDPSVIQSNKNTSIVFTALHGTGITLIPKVLEKAGFTNVHVVAQQDEVDGNFPTVDSPNPEEKEALHMALELAKEKDADLVMGTDPDADRVGLAVKNNDGEYELLNGNQAGAILVYYHLLKWQEAGKLDGKQFVASTIVTSDLIDEIVKGFGVNIYNTLTGFKYIAQLIRELEGEQKFIVGGEESFGYMIGDFVRDKDAVSSALIFSEIAAWARSRNTSLYNILGEIHNKFGFYKETLISIKKEGKAGKEMIAKMMEGFRTNPPKSFGGSDVIRMDDVLIGESVSLIDGSKTSINLDSSNVLQFYTEDGSKITARPSGTEPKIKFYISVQDKVSGDLKTTEQTLDERITQIEIDLKI